MNPARKATIALTLTTVVWGATFPATKAALDHLKERNVSQRLAPIWVNAARMLLALPLFLLVCPRSVRGLGSRELRDSLFVAAPGATGIFLQGWGLQDATVTVTAFLTNLTILFTPIFGYAFFREKLGLGLVAGAAIAFAGVVVLTKPHGGQFGRPEILVLLGSVSFALQIQLINRFTMGRNAESMTLGLMLHLTWLSVLPLLVFPDGREMITLRYFEPLPRGAWIHRWGVLVGVGFLAVFGSAVAFWVFMRWQREIPATRAAVLYALEPGFAALLAWALLHEHQGAEKLAGGAIILAGNLVCELWKGSTPAETGRPPPG